jgi:hypothetical protein
MRRIWHGYLVVGREEKEKRKKKKFRAMFVER